MIRRLPVFITGNQHNADYLARMLGVELAHQKIDLDEIQSTSLEQIVEHKVKQAYQMVGHPVIVEDVALEFRALGGLPGPFVRFFVDAPDGLNILCRMLDGFEDRSASTATVIGYYDGENLMMFRGGIDGMIAQQPQGDGGFGYDKIFIPNGYGGRTRAELSSEEDERTYVAMKPFAKLKAFLQQE